MPCSLLKVNRRFGGTLRLHLQARLKPACCVFHVGFLFDLFFDAEDGADTFVINVPNLDINN
jgi:hypothetical protein